MAVAVNNNNNDIITRPGGFAVRLIVVQYDPLRNEVPVIYILLDGELNRCKSNERGQIVPDGKESRALFIQCLRWT